MMKRVTQIPGALRFFLATILLLSLGAGRAAATLPDGYNHPELRWSVVEADHFQVVFHQGSEELARRCAAIAESIYEQVVKDLGAEPKRKTAIVLGDYSDESTAFAVREQKTIYISAPALNEARINGDEYLRALIAHEFTHVVTYWAVRGPYWDFGEWAGAAFLPQWFVEGLAQGEAYTFNAYGGFLIVRSATLEGDLSRLAEIDVGPATDQIDTWLTYAEGHALVSYIAQQFGKDKIKDILREYSRWRVFDLAIQRALGVSENELFRRWRASAIAEYQKLSPETENLQGVNVPLKAVISARFSPDGRKLAILGVADWEEPNPLLYVANSDGTGLHVVAGDLGLFTSVKIGWSSDSQKVFYSARRRTGTGAFRSGIYSVNADGSGRRLLSGDLRAADPAVSPQGDKIAFIAYQDASTVLATMDADGANVRYLTSPDAPYQCFSPAWGPDGKSIAFASVFGPYSAIALVDATGGNYQQLTSGARFDVDPQFSPDGRRIAFVSYYSGIPNVCSMAADGSEGIRMTDLKATSAFYPSWTPDGRQVLFSAFGTRDVTLRLVNAAEKVEDLPQLGLPSDTPSQSDSAATYPVRPYHPIREFRRFITRSMNAGDGRGTALGFLSEFADPLRKHTLSALTEFGVDSHRPFLDFRYTNSSLFPVISAEAFNRVVSPRADLGELVWDESSGMTLGVTFPQNPGGRLYRRDSTSLGLELSHRRPVDATGGLSPLPGGGDLRSASLVWRRSDRFPNKVAKSYALGHGFSGNGLGGDFDSRFTFASALHEWRVPNLKRLIRASVAYNNYDGEDFSHTPLKYGILSGRLGYRLRAGDDVSTSLWPLVYVARSFWELAWEHQELLSGSLAQPTGDFVSLELVNTGHLTRFGPFTATAGARWSAETGDTNLFFNLHVEALTVPLRQDQAETTLPSSPPPISQDLLTSPYPLEANP